MTSTGTAASAAGTTPDTATGGEWVSIIEAVRVLGLSERSVRRAVASGRLVSAIQGGRRVVRIDPAMTPTPDRHAAGGELVEFKPATTGTASGGGLVVATVIEAVERQAEHLRVDLARTRRHAAAGWSAAAAAFILASGGAIWGVRAIEQANGRAAAAEAAAGILARQAEQQAARADRLQTDLVRESKHRQQQHVEADIWGGIPWEFP